MTGVAAPAVSEQQHESARPSKRSRNRRGGHLGEFLLYLFVALLLMWPATLHLTTRFAGEADARHYGWVGWRIGELIRSGHVFSLHVPDVLWPFGLNLRLLDGVGPSLLAGAFNSVFGLYTAYNLTFVVGALLNMWAARYLARQLTSNRPVWIVAALAFATAPCVALNVQLGLQTLYFTFPVLLLTAEAVKTVKGSGSISRLRLGLLLTVAFLCSAYYAIFGGLLFVLVVAFGGRKVSPWRQLADLGVGVALAALLLLPFGIPRWTFDHHERDAGAPATLEKDALTFSPDALSIIAQPTRSTIRLPWHSATDPGLLRLPIPDYSGEDAVYPGLLLLAGLVGLGLWRSTWRRPLLVTAAVLWVCTLGLVLRIHGHQVANWMPYRLLLALPGLGGLRGPVRVAIPLAAIATAALVLCLDRLYNRATTTRARAVLLSGCGVLLATNLLLPIPQSTLGVSDRAQQALARIDDTRRPGETVLAVPSDCSSNAFEFAIFQVYHHAPAVGCTGTWAATPWYASLKKSYLSQRAFNALRCDTRQYGPLLTPREPVETVNARSLALLRRRLGVRYLLVFRRDLASPYCGAVRAALKAIPVARSLGGDDKLEVLDLGRSTGRST